MLEKLLHLLAEGGLVRVEEMTKRLAVSRPMLEAMIDELVRLGYLRPIQDPCAESCAGCPKAHCLMGDAGHLWGLTEKGAALLQKSLHQ